MVRRLLLGSQLRRLRETRGITREAAGYSIRASESRISRMELGRVRIKPRDVEDLLTLYGVADEAERATFVELAREASTAGWWHNYADIMPNWFVTYIGLEDAASRIRAYETHHVHGLLQTEAYATAMIKRGLRDTNTADVERRVALRLERQKSFIAENAPDVHVVLDEAALRRPYGDREVMRGQLQHLIEISERPNVQLQILPLGYGNYPDTSGAFTILSFPGPEVADVVYLEQLTSALYLDKREEVALYKEAMKELQSDSPGPTESRDLLRGLLCLS
ncbi:helix-turn-helix domain-containing protein [Streptomyces sp. NPDC013161]|uniref:helix-turn-helix domain-containing protein n=1 Tax=Streptomyces sp. NPDC013161 TaxID=3364862 RepID=UPI003699CF03